MTERTNIHQQLEGKAPEVLSHLNINPAALKGHIPCPIPGHDDRHPSFRVDAQKNRAYCSCLDGGCSLPDLVVHMGYAASFLESTLFLRRALGLKVSSHRKARDSMLRNAGRVPQPIPLAVAASAVAPTSLQAAVTKTSEDWDAFLQQCIPATGHAYCQKKCIPPIGALIDPGTGHIILRVHDVGGQTRGYQVITASGEKRFAKGTELARHGLLLGQLDESGMLEVCEGWATGVTLHIHLKTPVLVTFSAHNLLPAARPYQALVAKMRIFGDHDQNGAGQRAATAAAEEMNAELRLPPVPEGFKGSVDFNDLYVQDRAGGLSEFYPSRQMEGRQ